MPVEKEENNLCLNCPDEIRGLCCYFSCKFSNGENYILTNHPCKFLEKARCTIYEKRHDINKNCLTREEMIICGTIPKQCLYVKENESYQNRNDVRIVKIPSNLSPELKREYELQNNKPHGEIAIYRIERSFICPACKSKDIKELFIEESLPKKKNGKEDKIFCNRYFSYTCNQCHRKWHNPKLKVLKKSRGE